MGTSGTSEMDSCVTPGAGSSTSTPQPCPGAGAQAPQEVLCSLGCWSTLFFRSLGSWQDKDKKGSPRSPKPWDYLCLGQLFLILLVGLPVPLSSCRSSTAISSCDGQDWCDEGTGAPRGFFQLKMWPMISITSELVRTITPLAPL